MRSSAPDSASLRSSCSALALLDLGSLEASTARASVEIARARLGSQLSLPSLRTRRGSLSGPLGVDVCSGLRLGAVLSLGLRVASGSRAPDEVLDVGGWANEEASARPPGSGRLPRWQPPPAPSFVCWLRRAAGRQSPDATTARVNAKDETSTVSFYTSVPVYADVVPAVGQRILEIFR